MNSSLEKLAKNMNELKIVKKGFPGVETEKMELLFRKQVYPYEYIDSRRKLFDKCLPPQEDFYSTLTGESISDADYAHAQKVWRAFECYNLLDYTMLYMELDVLILADVFEEFCNKSMQAYKLDPAHYFTAPGLSFDAMLKYTQVELELLTDIDMVLFFESGIRGGISQCSNRYAKANNHYMEHFNQDEQENYIMYFDLNNLYGYAMQQYLPKGDFRWLKNQELENFDVTKIEKDSSKGYVLEVDLEYPEDLHDKHKDLPFCPQHQKPPGSKEKKLLTTLDDKNKYVIHYMYLRQVLDSGLILKKIHRVLQFSQSPWLKSYIDLNSKLRQNATNEFEKNFYKLMNNSIYGKTMENVRKRKDVKLVNKWGGRYGAEAWISKPNFHSCSIFDENLVAIQLDKLQVLINKPIYVGMCILDISKIVFYEFHYNFMKTLLKDNCKLLYIDTDSGIYDIKHKDIYKIMRENINRFDTSDYPNPNRYNIPLANKKIPGLMKDECNGKIVTEFIGLRSKMYCIVVENVDFVKKAKGVKSNVVKKSISSEHYRECLFNLKEVHREQYNITSKFHEIFTEKFHKLALSPFDDKRFLIKGSTDTLPWGHKDINKMEM